MLSTLPSSTSTDCCRKIPRLRNTRRLVTTNSDRPVCLELLAAINAAATSIDFAIYGVRAQDDIFGALAAAQARGVVVRGVVDSEDASCTSFGYSDTPTLMAALEPGSVVCDTGSGYSYIMHNKFFVFDRAKLWTGSTNISGDWLRHATCLCSIPGPL